MGEQKTGRNCVSGDSEEGENVGEASDKPNRHFDKNCSPTRSNKSVKLHASQSHKRHANGVLKSPSSSSHGRSRRNSRRASHSSASSSSSSSVSLIDPPDGGWGWAVVAASFIAHMIADGCAFTFGVFYSEFLEVFGESKGKTAAVGSVFLAVPLMTGPIAGALTNRYGCRKTTMIGGFIAGCGFVISSFMDSIEALFVTFGLIAGFGLSMVYVPAIVVVAFYFEKKRAFATGLAVAGTGIGTFVFAPLTEYLIQEYTWRGATLIIGGIMFNIIVAGTVFRPLTNPKIERQKRKFLENQEKFSRMSSKYTSAATAASGNTNAKGVDQGCSQNDLDKYMVEPVTQSLLHFPTFMKNEIEPLYPDSIEALAQAGQQGKTLQEVLTEHGLLDKFYHYHSLSDIQHVGVQKKCNRNIENTIDLVPKVTISNPYEGGPSSSKHLNGSQEAIHSKLQQSVSVETADVLATTGFLNDNNIARRGKRKISRNKGAADFDQLQPMSRKDIFYRGSLMRTRLPLTGKSASCPNIALNYEDESSTSDLYFQRFAVFSFLKVSREVKNTFTRMLHLSIFRSSVFLYFCLSSFLLYLAYDVPYVFTPDKAENIAGVSATKASFLVSLMGITSTVGQIVLGWIGDFPQVNAIHLYNVITSTGGVITLLVPWMYTYEMLCLYSAAYGFFISANYALTTIILVQLLGMDRLTNAYGIVMLAEGVANLVGPPAAGFISDATGDYDLTFIIAGVLITVSGAMLVLIPCLAKYDHVSNYDNVMPDSDSEESDDVSSDEGEEGKEKRHGGGGKKGNGGDNKCYGADSKYNGGETCNGGDIKCNGENGKSYGGQKQDHGGISKCNGEDRKSYGGDIKCYSGEKHDFEGKNQAHIVVKNGLLP